jgi:mannose-1-phosphate guanylyltransferase
LGTAGGLRKFKKEILEGNPEYLILMHCDIFCTFPVRELMEFHIKHGKECSILGKQVIHPHQSANSNLIRFPKRKPPSMDA